MSNVYETLRQACDISQLEAAENVHGCSLDTAKSYSSGRRIAPQWAINQLQSLVRRIQRAGENFAYELKGMVAAGYSLQIGTPADNADALAHGFPSAASAMRAIAIAISLLPDDAEIQLINRAEHKIAGMPKLEIAGMPKLESDKVLPTASDRKVIEDMDFAGPKSQCYTSGNINRRKFERLEDIGWVTHFCPNASDVVYDLTPAGALELALVKEARFAESHPSPIPAGVQTRVTGMRPRIPVNLTIGKRIRFGHASFLVDAIDDDVVVVRDENDQEMTLSVPKILLAA